MKQWYQDHKVRLYVTHHFILHVYYVSLYFDTWYCLQHHPRQLQVCHQWLQVTKTCQGSGHGKFRLRATTNNMPAVWEPEILTNDTLCKITMSKLLAICNIIFNKTKLRLWIWSDKNTSGSFSKTHINPLITREGSSHTQSSGHITTGFSITGADGGPTTDNTVNCAVKDEWIATFSKTKGTYDHARHIERLPCIALCNLPPWIFDCSWSSLETLLAPPLSSVPWRRSHPASRLMSTAGLLKVQSCGPWTPGSAA